MILLWGPATDAPLAAVLDALRRLDIPFIHLDQRAVLSTSVELEIGGAVAGFVHSDRQRVDLGAVRACYIRPDDSYRLRDVAAEGETSAAWLHAINVDDALLSWTELTPAFVVNRPSAMSSNSSKPYQLQLIRAHGFDVPDTLVTTDPAAVLAFREEHGEIVYKSISSIRSKVSKFRLEHVERINDVTSCPTQFQKYIPGVDYRVHIVGTAVFSARIDSTADDYRYAGDEFFEVTPCEIPASLAERCQGLAAGLGLPVAGIDLRQSPDQTWYCFEVNPSPGFTYYDRAPGQPIASAVASLLARGAAGP